MPSDDLNSIPGLEEKHLRALSRQNVTDLRGLADADQQAIYRAMASLRPRPTLEQISRWQDEAGNLLAATETDASDWHPAASFVLVFSQRRTGEAWERRTEAERTEVEPEQDPRIWSGWDCEPICTWILDQLNQAGHAEPGPQPAAEEAPDARDRAQLRIESAAIIDATGTADVAAAGVVVTNPPTELVAPVRVVFTVSGARPGMRLQAVARILRRDGPGWNPQDPVTIGADGRAEFDLAAVPAGELEMSLLAWAPDATASLASLRLPKVVIRM